MKTYHTRRLCWISSSLCSIFYYCKSRYPNKLALGIHQATARVFRSRRLATHRFQYVLRTRSDSERIGQTEKGRRLGAVAIFSRASTAVTLPLSAGGSSLWLKARGRGGSRATPIRPLVLSRAQSSFPEAENRCCVWWVEMRPSKEGGCGHLDK